MENLEFYLLGFAGVVLHLLKKVYEARKGQIDIDWILEGLSTLISIIIVGLLVHSKDDMESFYPLTKLTSIFLGYGAQSIFRFIANATQPKL